VEYNYAEIKKGLITQEITATGTLNALKTIDVGTQVSGKVSKIFVDLLSKEKTYQFIEVMACPGGCIGGGGQPLHHGNSEIIKARAAALYTEDRKKPLRKSH